MTQPRAADDFAMIRARMKELRGERERAEAIEGEVRSDPPARPVTINIGVSLPRDANRGYHRLSQSVGSPCSQPDLL